jgi:hypothetical protein
LPHGHSNTPSNRPDMGLGNHNYCRNPDGEPDGIWCYTTDSNKRWEYCDPISESLTGKGQDYRGKQNKTISGKTCQKWTSTDPHGHHYATKSYLDGIGDHNYCRNPGGGEDTIWCYTTDPAKRWEKCKPLPN